MNIIDMMHPVESYFISLGLNKLPYCTLIYLGTDLMGALKLGLCIPSSAFEMQDGGVILPALYKAFYEKIVAETAGSNVNLYFDGSIDAANTCISQGIYAVPFRLGEIETANSLDSLVRNERHDYGWHWPIGRMNPDILRSLKALARARTTLAKNPAWPRSPQPECLIGPSAVSMCGPEHADSASKCARKLIAWISDRRIVEFGRRNALKALDGSEHLRGKSGNGGGVEDALRILIAGAYIQKCPSPPSDYACKRPSPWYLVNPALAGC
jgi:hypothetical protein